MEAVRCFAVICGDLRGVDFLRKKMEAVRETIFCEKNGGCARNGFYIDRSGTGLHSGFGLNLVVDIVPARHSVPRGVQQDQDKTGRAKRVRVVLSVFPGMSPGVMGELGMSERFQKLMRLTKSDLVERLLVAEDKVDVLMLGIAAERALNAPSAETEAAPAAAEPAPPAPTIVDLLRDGTAHYYVDGVTLVISVPRPSGRQVWEFTPATFRTASERKNAMEQLAAHIADAKPLRKEQWRRR